MADSPIQSYPDITTSSNTKTFGMNPGDEIGWVPYPDDAASEAYVDGAISTHDDSALAHGGVEGRMTTAEADITNNAAAIDGVDDALDERAPGVGGTTGQVWGKVSNTDYDAAWIDASSAVDSVNGQTGVVVLDSDDISDAGTNKFATAAQLSAVDALGTASTQDTGDFATAAQGALADSATQPGDLGTAAAEDVDYFATAAQGALADSALQDVSVPGDIDATGTPSSTTYLRGDGTWATPAGGGGGDVDSVNGQTGVVVLDSDDISDAGTNKFATAAQLSAVDALGTASTSAIGDFATAAQGALADSATQPGDLATVATTGDYDDLTGKPTLGTAAAAATGDFATAAQGATADSALQDVSVPGDIDATGTPSASTFLRGDGTWASPAGGGGGDLLAANNLSDLDNAGTARTNLGLGTAAQDDTGDFATAAQGSLADSATQPGDLGDLATQDTVNNSDWSGADLAVTNGGTGASNAGDARTNLGLGSAAQDDTGDFATAAQGTLADSATQPGDLATVATTGDYDDLTGKPTLGTAAAAATGDFATAAQGALADSATQPGDLGDLATQDTVNNSDWSGTDLAITNGGTGASDASGARTALGVDTAITTAIDALKATLYCSVNHGATAGTARPTGYAGVIWYGSVAPTNATGADLVIRTDEAVTP